MPQSDPNNRNRVFSIDGKDTPIFDSLPDDEKVYVLEYCRTFNKAAAVRAMGITQHISMYAFEMSRKKQIRDAIEEILSVTVMMPNEVLARLAAQARANITDFMNDAGIIDPSKIVEGEASHAIKKYKVNFNAGTIELELYDAQNALQFIGKHYKLFADVQVQGNTNKGDGTHNYSDADLENIIENESS